jgi:putative proteasome-type protease
MTYCVGIKVDAGLVFAADSRTNAGVDHVSTYSKMHVFEQPGQRVFVVLSAGNLATSQAVINALRRGFADPAVPGLLQVRDVFEAAEFVGNLSYRIQQEHAEALTRSGASAEASFIIGGEVGDSGHEVCLVYAQGNYIAATPETPYLQIGETKYGKPILDRIIAAGTTLDDAARCALVSLDSTIRANISVGPPLDLAICERGAHRITRRLTLGADSPLYLGVQTGWNEGLKRAFLELPRFEWELGPS